MLPRMLIEALVRAAHILRSQPGYTMPLHRLHAQLVAEPRLASVSYGEIYQHLQKRADSFVLLDSPRLLGNGEGWPGMVREAYDNALDGVGLGSCVRVTLTEPPPEGAASELLAALNGSVALLIEGTTGDGTLHDYVARATLQLGEMNRVMQCAGTDHPTTPPPDLRP